MIDNQTHVIEFQKIRDHTDVARHGRDVEPQATDGAEPAATRNGRDSASTDAGGDR